MLDELNILAVPEISSKSDVLPLIKDYTFSKWLTRISWPTSLVICQINSPHTNIAEMVLSWDV